MGLFLTYFYNKAGGKRELSTKTAHQLRSPPQKKQNSKRRNDSIFAQRMYITPPMAKGWESGRQGERPKSSEPEIP